MNQPSTGFRFAVNVTPKPGILDPQGRAIEGSLGHLGIEGVSAIRVGRRVELSVAAADEVTARDVVDRLAHELLANPLIEAYAIEELGATSSIAGAAPSVAAPRGAAPGGPAPVIGTPT